MVAVPILTKKESALLPSLQCMLALVTHTLEHHAAKNRREVTQRTQTRKPQCP